MGVGRWNLSARTGGAYRTKGLEKLGIIALQPLISIVIPSWNRRALLVECLTSLARQSYEHHETIVVDDASTDDTREVLAAEFPKVRCISLAKNRGFCGAVNSGLRAAKGPLVFLLNNDMTLEPECLAHLAEAAQASSGAIFAPLVLCRDDPARIYSAGDGQRADGRPSSIGHQQEKASFVHPGRIFGASGGAALYRREMLERIGLLDERFGAYFEDSDLNFRARLAGYEAHYAPEAILHHLGSASLDERHTWRAQQCCRNHLLLVLKNMPAKTMLRHAPEILRERLHQNARVFTVARAHQGLLGAVGAWLGMQVSTWVRLPGALAARMAIQSRRTITSDDLEALLDQEGEAPCSR